MVFVLQVLVSLFFFANKVFVLLGKRTGWLLGVIAAVLGIFYFYIIGFYVFSVMQLGLFSLMSYGFLSHNEKNSKVETWIRIMSVVVMTVLAISAFSGLLTLIELVSALCLISGTYYVAQGRTQLGWGICVLGHLAAAYLGYSKGGQQLFADFQIASAIVSFVGSTLKK